MDDVRTIAKDGKTYAQCFRADLHVRSGVRFATENEDPLQVGIFERDKGYEVPAHRHNGRALTLTDVGEFLWVQSGSMRIEVFDEEWNVLDTWTARSGDCIVLLRGGHAISMLEPTRLLEVKQGPYPGKEREKTFRTVP